MPSGEAVRNGHKRPQKRRWTFSGGVYILVGEMRVEAILGRFARSEVLREKRGHPSTSFQWGTIPQGDG